jgi:glucose/mannose-6-phosphate isomerase
MILLNLITNADILKVDQTFVHRAYEDWPKHFQKASSIGGSSLDHGPGSYESLVLCGMGGSGTSSDILHELVQYNGGIPSVVLKGGHIPQFVNRRSLVIACSVSGNTSETISMVEECSKKGAEVICISSGGRLKEKARQAGLNHIDIPNLSLPRASLPYLLMPSIKIVNSILEKPIDISTTYKSLETTSKKVSIHTPYEANASKQIADFMEGGLGFCFTSPMLISAGIRFKNSLNENSKLHCLSESIMEASHNEIVPFTFHNNFQSRVLLLSWSKDSTDITNRFGKFKILFKRIKQPFMQINMDKRNLLDAIVCSIYTLDFASIYMAVSRKIDPSPTPAIDILKGLS